MPAPSASLEVAGWLSRDGVSKRKWRRDGGSSISESLQSPAIVRNIMNAGVYLDEWLESEGWYYQRWDAENGPFVRLIDLRLQHIRTIGEKRRCLIIFGHVTGYGCI